MTTAIDHKGQNTQTLQPFRQTLRCMFRSLSELCIFLVSVSPTCMAAPPATLPGAQALAELKAGKRDTAEALVGFRTG